VWSSTVRWVMVTLDSSEAMGDDGARRGEDGGSRQEQNVSQSSWRQVLIMDASALQIPAVGGTADRRRRGGFIGTTYVPSIEPCSARIAPSFLHMC
jgi:hypothetical protein